MDWNKTEKEGEKEREKVIQQLSVTFVGSLHILHFQIITHISELEFIIYWCIFLGWYKTPTYINSSESQ